MTLASRDDFEWAAKEMIIRELKAENEKLRSVMRDFVRALKDLRAFDKLLEQKD